MKLVAVHQPNFFPWLGFFDKIRRADIFVVLDDAQLQKTGGSWTNRVRLLANGAPRWLTAPLDRRFSGVRSIADMSYATEADWRNGIRAIIEEAYRKAPHFPDVMSRLLPLIGCPEQSVTAYNLNAVKSLAEELGLTTSHFLLASKLGVSSVGTERLVELVRASGGDTYLEGGGARDYQNDGSFERNGISILRQDFVALAYPQLGAADFVAGMSVIDALMNVGFARTAELLSRSPVGAPRAQRDDAHGR